MAGETKNISRREMLRRSAALTALASAQFMWPGWMPRLSFADKNSALKGDILVCVFLRGGADGLNVIVPHGEKAYYQARPTINIARPDDSSADSKNRALDLDGFFGLNPAMAPLLPIFKAHQMLAVHATGSPDPTRSHFDAMDFMERGVPGNHTLSSGWLGRHLEAMASNSPLRAIGWGNALQQSLRGSVSAISLKSIVDFHLQGRPDAANDMLKSLNQIYAAGPTDMKTVSDQTNAILDIVGKVNVAGYKPAADAQYSNKSDFDMALMQTAALIKADVGLEVAAIDLGGWDTHHNETVDLPNELDKLSKGLAAFHADMGDLMGKITVVVMSEFGRRVQENASKGTDHGHGNMMLVMGNNVTAKPVVAKWPGLTKEQLSNGDDLQITTDYRDVLAEILTTRVGNDQMGVVFPNFTLTAPGVVKK